MAESHAAGNTPLRTAVFSLCIARRSIVFPICIGFFAILFGVTLWITVDNTGSRLSEMR